MHLVVASSLVGLIGPVCVAIRSRRMLYADVLLALKGAAYPTLDRSNLSVLIFVLCYVARGGPVYGVAHVANSRSTDVLRAYGVVVCTRLHALFLLLLSVWSRSVRPCYVVLFWLLVCLVSLSSPFSLVPLSLDPLLCVCIGTDSMLFMSSSLPCYLPLFVCDGVLVFYSFVFHV